MESDPSIGIAGCRLELEDGTSTMRRGARFRRRSSALGHFTGVGRRERAPGTTRRSTVRRPSSAARRRGQRRVHAHSASALDEVGLFDEGYWMYMEDLDLCYRLREAGWITWYEPA